MWTHGVDRAPTAWLSSWTLRRALLAVGDRLVAHGRVASRDLAIELLASELAAGDLHELPDGRVLQARSEARAVQRLLQPPLLLGPAVLLGATFLGFQAYEYSHAFTELNLTLAGRP